MLRHTIVLCNKGLAVGQGHERLGLGPSRETGHRRVLPPRREELEQCINLLLGYTALDQRQPSSESKSAIAVLAEPTQHSLRFARISVIPLPRPGLKKFQDPPTNDPGYINLTCSKRCGHISLTVWSHSGHDVFVSLSHPPFPFPSSSFFLPCLANIKPHRLGRNPGKTPSHACVDVSEAQFTLACQGL